MGIIKGILICVKCYLPFLAADGYYDTAEGQICKNCGNNTIQVKTEKDNQTVRAAI